MSTSPPSPLSPPAVLPGGWVAGMLLVSGVVALVYEVVWQRQFSLLFGSAAPATAAVLAGYFTGLGLGAWLVGRWAGRARRPLRVYAFLELGVGMGALMVTPFLTGYEQASPWSYEWLSIHPAWYAVVRTTVVFFALLLPTFCLGGTLPLLGSLVDGGRRQLGLTAGWLYVVNTAGAGLGALSFPFFFLPQLGLAGTIGMGAVVNGLLASAAWWLDRRVGVVTMGPQAIGPGASKGARAASRTSKRPVADAASRAFEPAMILPALVSGVATFSLQVLWNRAFAQIHENSMYSFSISVAVVIFALAIGAQLARSALRRGFAPPRLIGAAWMLGGAVVVIGPWLFLRLSDNLAYLSTSGSWWSHGGKLAGLALAVLLPPFTLLGVGLPAMMEQAGRKSEENAGQVLGRILGANVIGSIVGALAAGFVLPRLLGLWSSVFWLGGLVFVAGLWLWVRWMNDTRQRVAGLVLGCLSIALAWPVARLELPRVRLASDRDEKLIALNEGTHGITAVVERPGSRRLKLNNHYGLGGTGSTGDERMQAHLPLLLHPAPHRVAFLGLGTGITAGGALFHPVDEVTVVELVPEVVAASREYFRLANRGVLDDGRTKVIADDARNYLRGSGARFDVIVGDLVVPWRQGEGSLFTLEQFTAARRALAPGGLFCQWLPLFQLSETEVTILARTFLTVFPHAHVWRGDFSPTEPAIALIGSNAEMKLDFAQLRRGLAEMKPDPSNPQLQSADAVWMGFVGELVVADLPSGETRLNREDRPWIELLGSMLQTGENKNALFTGRRLQAWLDEVADRSQNRLLPWPKREAAAVAAGRVLAELTLSLAEENRVGARAAQDKLRELLPAETYRLLFP